MRVKADIGNCVEYIKKLKGINTNRTIRYQWRVDKISGVRGILAGQFDTVERLTVQEFSATILANIRLYKSVLNFNAPDNLAQLCRDAVIEARKRMVENEGDEYERDE